MPSVSIAVAAIVTAAEILVIEVSAISTAFPKSLWKRATFAVNSTTRLPKVATVVSPKKSGADVRAGNDRSTQLTDRIDKA